MDASVKFTEVYNFERKHKILEYAHNIKFAIIPKIKQKLVFNNCNVNNTQYEKTIFLYTKQYHKSTFYNMLIFNNYLIIMLITYINPYNILIFIYI